jgi:N utilization substance protein A
MLDVKQFSYAITQIAEEKNIPREKIVEVVEMALAAAYKKEYVDKGYSIKVHLNEEAGTFEVYWQRKVVKVDREGNIVLAPEERLDENGEERKIRYNEEKHITLSEAKALQSNIKEGEMILEQLKPKEDFGRIAAQTAKQVVMQRIREIERETTYDLFKDKVGEVVMGTIQRIDRGVVYVDIGKNIALLFPSDQVMSERYQPNSRMKFFILSVEETDRDPNILLSRRNPEFIKKLFSLEVPEIFSGSVEVKGIAREPGVRTKISVASKTDEVDPVGACVGQRGTRVQSVINELHGEKIDIIEYNDDTTKYIKSAIAPAKVVQVDFNEVERRARVIIPDDQLSLAIGGGGQNVRLASQLTGWDIDLRGESTLQASAPAKDEAVVLPIQPEIVDEKDIVKEEVEVQEVVAESEVGVEEKVEEKKTKSKPKKESEEKTEEPVNDDEDETLELDEEDTDKS